MKVLLTKKFAESDLKYISDRINAGIELIEPKDYKEDTIIQQMQSADVLFGGLLSEPIVSRAEHIRFAQIPWTGVDNLNFSMLNQYGLTICNSHSNAILVAEHAISLAFALAKKIPYLSLIHI